MAGLVAEVLGGLGGGGVQGDGQRPGAVAAKVGGDGGGQAGDPRVVAARERRRLMQAVRFARSAAIQAWAWTRPGRPGAAAGGATGTVVAGRVWRVSCRSAARAVCW